MNNILDWDKFQQTRKHIEEKALALMKQEAKDFATTGVPLENYTQYLVDGRVFYTIKTNVYKYLMEKFYLEAHEKYPEKFGTGNATDVLEALYKVRAMFDFESYVKLLNHEQFAFLIETIQDSIVDKTLRIDLFRKLDKVDNTDNLEFTGGLLHALKHFLKNDLNLSTGKDIFNIDHPEAVIPSIIQAFFIEQGKFERPEKLVSRVKLTQSSILKFVFYRELNSDVFFIKTIFKKAS